MTYCYIFIALKNAEHITWYTTITHIKYTTYQIFNSINTYILFTYFWGLTLDISRMTTDLFLYNLGTHSTRWLAYWTQNKEPGPTLAGSNPTRFAWGARVIFPVFSLYKNDISGPFPFKSPPRRHPFYSSMNKTGRVLIKFILSFLVCYQLRCAPAY